MSLTGMEQWHVLQAGGGLKSLVIPSEVTLVQLESLGFVTNTNETFDVNVYCECLFFMPLAGN
jgi:hypothetical protein